MKLRLFYLAAAVVIAFLAAAWPVSAQAQVAVGPGFVVAPFVHVQWNGRQVHVCAPFVNLTVDVPRCCGSPPTCGEANQITGTYSQSTSRLYGHPTRQQLAQSADKLYQSLEQFQTAESWRHYLALAPNEALSAEQLHQPDSAAAAKLGNVLRHFDAANRDEQYRIITTVPAFQQTHALLANYLAQQPSSLYASAETPDAAFVNAAGAKSLRTTRIGWAVDTAHMPTLNTARTSAQDTVVTPDADRATVEELPAPTEKSGI